VYACAIDASKAFDKVNRELLMHILHRKVDDEIWLILRSYYNNSSAYVKNGEKVSPLFTTSIGVKQGGPLSPKLFSIYINELINRILDERDLLANINNIKTGLILYADDVIILTESVGTP
jgi:retron-type reverse transcriptase